MGIGGLPWFIPAVLDAAQLNQLAAALTALGCPPGKSAEMAAHLDKRARQLMIERGGTYEHAMAHLLGLMKQGWAAQAANGGGVGSQDSGVSPETASRPNAPAEF
jgi:hypothetical protein